MSINLSIKNNKEEEDEEEEQEKIMDKEEQQIELQLGDIILIKDPTNEIIDNHIFFIQYIDSQKIKLIDESDLSKVQIKIDKNGLLNNGTISEVELLYRNKYPGYAKQNHLLPGQWITIYFGGEIPTLVTGEITNLEEDMIEVNKYPENEVFYLNFDYKGLPENIPIESIQLRDPITKEKEGEQGEEEKEKEGEQNIIDEEDLVKVGEEYVLDDLSSQREEEQPVKQIKETLKQNIIEADQIEFGSYMAPIQEFVNLDKENFRFNLETQTNDLLDDILSNVPPNKRTNELLNNIHIMITRFIQLRTIGSKFDKNKNIISVNTKTANDKPLAEYLSTFQNKLYWLLLVVKNIKKVYDVPESKDEDNVDSDISASKTEEMLESIQQLFSQFKATESTHEQNKYFELYSSLNPIMTPFISIPPENSNSIICEHLVSDNLNTIVDNLGDLYSSTIKDDDVIVSRRFVVERYNTGLSRLDATNVKGSKMIAHVVPLTSNDLLSIQSILTLPEPTVRFSQINLPGSNILTKSNLQLHFLNYWQLLKKNTPLNKVEITDLNTEIDYDENNFVDNIKHYLLDLEQDQQNNFSHLEKYEKFLNIIIPKIRVLFNLTKKYIHGKLSIVNLISYLEPFLIYSNDLTYMQYVEMTKFIREKISEYNKTFVENGRLIALLKNVVQQKKQPLLLLEILNQNMQNKNIVVEKYGFTNTYLQNHNNSELLKKTIMIDFGNLYNTAVAFENMTLMFPSELNAIFELDKDKLKQVMNREEDNNSCKNYVVAKKYSNLEELLGDNGKVVYFDKKYDSTPYYLLDDFVQEKNRLSPEEFVLFLSDKLQKKQKYSAYDAEYTAESLVTGFKKVVDGQYAIVYNDSEEGQQGEGEAIYYVRKNNEWIEDKNIDREKFVDESDALCIIQPDCLFRDTNANTNDCESLQLSKSTLVSNALNEILGQFDKNYQLSKEELVKRLTSYLEKYATIFDKIVNIEKHQFYQYNNQQYELGLLISEENNTYIHSPYESLRDLIMGQSDFVKKQNDIIKFVTKFTRPAIEGQANINDGELETPFWLYCQKTNAKLLPSFIYKIASVFIQNSEKYNETMNNIVKVQGKLSDDGDSWVDKYSGYHIKPIDWDNEEEIFRIQSRDLLEEDAGQNVASLTAKKILNPQSKMIQNVVQSLTTFMGISLGLEQNEFILGTVNNLINDTGVLVKKPTYEKYMEEMAKKGKKIPEYENVYYSTLLYLTLGTLLIAIQTSIPSIRTKKTFPGCVRSFSGFPMEGEGDYSGLTYLACIVNKIKSSSVPWLVLTKVSQEKIAESIKNFTTKYLLSQIDVEHKIKEKVNYLLSYPDEDIPDSHSLQMWTNFLPPLKKFKIKNLQNVSDGFIDVLTREIRNGAPDQNERILVIESKIIEYSLAIQECIQKIIDKKTLLLKNSVHPYLDNACCNEKERLGFTALQYFVADNFEIANYNLIVENLSLFIRDIQLLTEAPMFLSSVDTKRYYPPVDSHFNEETIYTAFITYCKMNSYIPIPVDLLPLCKNKPEFLNVNETIQETIYKLKREGHQYSEESLLRLLQIVSRNGIVPINISFKSYAPIQRLRDLLEMFDRNNDEIIASKLRNSIETLLDTYDISVTSDTQDMRDLKNYLDKANNIMKSKLLNFIKQKSTIDNRNYRKLEEFVKNIAEWSFDKNKEITNINVNAISDDGMYNYIQFFKTYIFMFSKVYPNMILNEQIHSLQPPKYWGLSKRHENVLIKEVNDFYNPIKKFYGNKSILTLLHKIQDKCNNLILLSQETPALTPIKNGSIVSYSVFDKRISTLLFEYYLLQVLTSYIELTNDPNMLYHSEDIENELDGNVNTLKKETANLLVAYINIMQDTKSTIDISHDMISDKVFKLKEREKDTFTDRLKDMSHEARNVDNILKINKLGVWNKGLTKGLKEYDPENFDQEREIMTKIAEIEKKVRRNPNVNEQNLDSYVEDYIEDMNIQAEADEEDYDMSNMNDDYMDGDYYGDEEENPQDYD